MTTAKYLVGIAYHEPEAYGPSERGLAEDYEGSTGLSVAATSPDTAVEWGERVGRALLRHPNGDAAPDGKPLGDLFWVVESRRSSRSGRCLC